MRIHPLSTGAVSVKESMLHARMGPARQLRLFLPSPFSDPLPIHCWVVEHEGRRLLVDTGETAAARDIPFARFDVPAARELPAMLATIGLTPDDLDQVVLTHMHGDHMDGAVHLGGRPVDVHDAEIAFSRGASARFFRRLLRQPLPDGVEFRPMSLDDGPFGAFAASRRLSDDGRIVAVATPGHTPGHIAVICVDDEGRHVMLAGDATDTLEQLLDRRADAIGPDPRVHRETLERILVHGREHPTVFLPSHDPQSAERLAAGTVLAGPAG